MLEIRKNQPLKTYQHNILSLNLLMMTLLMKQQTVMSTIVNLLQNAGMVNVKDLSALLMKIVWMMTDAHQKYVILQDI